MRKISEEDERTADTAPDHISTSDASEADTNNSQPPLLDFVGATCLASAADPSVMFKPSSDGSLKS